MTITEITSGLAINRNRDGFAVTVLDIESVAVDIDWSPAVDPGSDRPSPVWAAAAIIAAAREWHRVQGRPPMADEWRLADPDGDRPTVSQVLTVFGKWNEMLAAAGFSRRTGGRGNVSQPIAEHAA